MPTLTRRLTALEKLSEVIDGQREQEQNLGAAFMADPFEWFRLWFALEFEGLGKVRKVVSVPDQAIEREIALACDLWNSTLKIYGDGQPQILLYRDEIDEALDWLRTDRARIRPEHHRTEWWWIGSDVGEDSEQLRALNAAIRNWCLQTGEDKPVTSVACIALLDRWRGMSEQEEAHG